MIAVINKGKRMFLVSCSFYYEHAMAMLMLPAKSMPLATTTITPARADSENGGGGVYRLGSVRPSELWFQADATRFGKGSIHILQRAGFRVGGGSQSQSWLQLMW